MRVLGTMAAVTLVAIAIAVADWRSPPPPTVAAAPAKSGARILYPSGRVPVLTLPDGSRRQVRSMINEQRPLRFGDYLWNEDGVPPGEAWVRIDLGRQTLSVFRAGHEIGSTVILFGTDGKPTPSGIFPIMAKERDHQSTLYEAEMPYMIRLTGDGVAIHASDVRKGSATHGCIGVPPGFAALLFDQVRRGDRVVILPAPHTA